MAKDTLVIGQSQQTPTPLDMANTLAGVSVSMAQAATWGVQLLVLPEMCLSGYNINKDELASVAQPANGELFNAVATLCRQHNMALAYGYAEIADDNQYYNSVQVVDATGTSLVNCRKTHLWDELDRRLFSAGQTLAPVIELDGWKLGVAICYDIEFPEVARTLALRGADLIIVPTGLMSPYLEVADQVIPVRAYENRLFVAYTNYCGRERDLEYVGHSCIADPNGQLLASAQQQPVLLTATLERSVLDDARQALPYLQERRPELYELKDGNIR